MSRRNSHLPELLHSLPVAPSSKRIVVTKEARRHLHGAFVSNSVVLVVMVVKEWVITGMFGIARTAIIMAIIHVHPSILRFVI